MSGRDIPNSMIRLLTDACIEDGDIVKTSDRFFLVNYSFAAEVEYHAKFLSPLAKIKIPFFGRSIYESAIRADMTICDTEMEGPAPFYKEDSKIVKRQYTLHQMLVEK